MSEPKRHRHAPTEAQQYESYKQSVFYEKAFNAGAAAQIEKDAGIAVDQAMVIAEAIRAQLKP